MNTRFAYIAYDGQSIAISNEAKAACEAVEKVILSKLSHGREQDLALAKIEECFMWIGKSIRNTQTNREGSKNETDIVTPADGVNVPPVV